VKLTIITAATLIALAVQPQPARANQCESLYAKLNADYALAQAAAQTFNDFTDRYDWNARAANAAIMTAAEQYMQRSRALFTRVVASQDRPMRHLEHAINRFVTIGVYTALDGFKPYQKKLDAVNDIEPELGNLVWGIAGHAAKCGAAYGVLAGWSGR
jgi:hypothetical protein